MLFESPERSGRRGPIEEVGLQAVCGNMSWNAITRDR
jgi:hypothetical protein